jgi:elongation factor 2 kinase
VLVYWLNLILARMKCSCAKVKSIGNGERLEREMTDERLEQVDDIYFPTQPFAEEGEKAVRQEYDSETKTWKSFFTVLKLERRPFAVGSRRSAYMMKDLTEGEAGKEFVAKLSNDPSDQKNIYYERVAMQMEAQEFAKKFNKRFGKKVVEFLVAYVAELVERPGKPLIGIEQRIHGNYVKYNNNWDWTDERRNTPQAFSHFSWEESGHRILICDLQGVGDKWTDPQVLSSDGKGYGKVTLKCSLVLKYLNLGTKISRR